jgi:cellulose synthase/poly-beta-1,6-N-acetylglucosamine synthase-like glycosyltransferase
MMATFAFWFLFFVLLYALAGYGGVLFILVIFKRFFRKKTVKPVNNHFEPFICLFVTAYNEKDYVRQKVENSDALEYPKEKIQHIWVTDGSDDGTPDLLQENPCIEVFHQPERRGKIDAMNRGMQFVKAPFVIFSDTNTLLSPNTIRVMMEPFSHPEVGCVAGEKRITEKAEDSASGAGEGFYWKIESGMKKLDAELNSAVGGVGELFAIRTELFEPVEADTILDDFTISLRIAAKGYKIDYTSEAWAEETASLNVSEELKRKSRIAAGGIQTLTRLAFLLNPFKYGWLSWQFFSHKVLRWTVFPFFLFLLLPVNIWLVAENASLTAITFPTLLLWLQGFCYLLALSGWIFESRKIRMKIFFLPYYFVAINYASMVGIIRFIRGKQKVTWEKSRRAQIQVVDN